MVLNGVGKMWGLGLSHPQVGMVAILSSPHMFGVMIILAQHAPPESF